ncbi:MAG: gliding motility-associated C-terminal domain-containing protein [Bacteroidales bacterium]|nr:gliding motility-associated C-terminal domain-containing protein [Bacteroidales bacterium]
MKYLLLGFGLIFYINGFSQISSAALFSEATEYSDSDFVFVFCTDDANGGSLVAEDSIGFGGYNFEWFKYNELTNDFTDTLTGFSIINNSTRSVISNLANGGYKVVLTKPDTIQEYVAWVYNNTNISIEIQFHQENDCDYLALITDPYYHTSMYFNTPLNYFNVITGDSYTLQNKLDLYEWTSSPEMDSFRSFNGPFTSVAEDPTDNNSELPTENTIFSVTITDRFGCQAEDDIEYFAIETDADFSWTSIDNKTEDVSTGSSENEISGSAPLKVSFVNESLNGANYIWFFGDTLRNNDIDTIFTSDFLEEPEHTYYYTVADSGRTYVLRLFSESEYGCKDSIFFNIKVEPSLIEFPNVFTPYSTFGENDKFILLDYQSIRSFKITIFNRVGQVVHEFVGDISDWEGWDGKVRNSNREAPAGNYFFVVEILGWDNVTYDNNNQGKQPSTQSSDAEAEQDPNTNTGGAQFGVVRLF